MSDIPEIFDFAGARARTGRRLAADPFAALTPQLVLDSQIAEVKARAARDPYLQQRSDGWQNPFTGIGTAADKTKYGRFFPTWRVPDLELTWMYDSDATMAFVCPAIVV